MERPTKAWSSRSSTTARRDRARYSQDEIEETIAEAVRDALEEGVFSRTRIQPIKPCSSAISLRTRKHAGL